jgi:ribonuclease R
MKKKNPAIKKDYLTGTLRLHPRGFGFVIPDHITDSAQDIFIPKHLTDNAVDGDKVEVEIDQKSTSVKGPEGRIVSILKRSRTHLAGTIRNLGEKGHAVAYVPLLGVSKPVLVEKSNHTTLKVGDRIIMKVLEWGDQHTQTLCEMSHYLGHISDPSCDTSAAAEEFDLRTTFPQETIDQAKKYGSKVTAKDKKERLDLTPLTAITIDPDTAKDFDDALSIDKERNGTFHLSVHIADVAHYVKAGTPLDKEASLRCNSTYFPGSCIPMLPEELSNELCSLKPDVLRLTVSVLMDFDKEGTLLKHQIVRSVIKSAKRLTYLEAREIIDGAKSPYSKQLKWMVELCTLLKQKRSLRGSIDFSLPEIVVQIDEKGEPFGLKVVEYDISHQLVEEFMLKANEVVAKELSDRKKTQLYRIHEEPSEENSTDFFALARSLGFQLPQKPTHQDLQKLFEEAKKTPFGQQLSIGFIRSMRLAFYSPDNVGHYGLALEHYCHFTSPIRRYSDLITQRILFDELPEETQLEKIALKCSEAERISFRAESSVKTLKKLRLLSRFLKEDPKRQYKAIVTRVKPFGLSFELAELSVEGFLHISELEDDYFLFDERQNTLFGKASGKKHSIGEHILVRPISIDLILFESKWELVTATPRKRSSNRRRRR